MAATRAGAVRHASAVVAAVDFVQRDGRLASREMLLDADDGLAAAGLTPSALIEGLDGATVHTRRMQLVGQLSAAAQVAVCRADALYRHSWLSPLARAAPILRHAQLGLAAVLIVLVSVGITPSGGCGVACWAAQSCGIFYAALAAALLLDASLETAGGVGTLFWPPSWLDGARPVTLVRQAALLALALAALIVHPQLFLLTCLDLLPNIPRCRTILRPLGRAALPVLAIASLAAALSLPAVATAREAGAAAECAAGDAAACAVQALATVAPATVAAFVRQPSGMAALEGSDDAPGAPAGGIFSQLGHLGPLAMLGMGALLLQLGVAVLVDALADQRSRSLAASEYASEHCLMCGASRKSLETLGPRAFATHVSNEHAPHKYARLIAEAWRVRPSERTADDEWIVECALKGDAAFLPWARREYWGPLPDGGQKLGWRPVGWEPGAEAALGWQLEPEPSAAQLRAAIQDLAADSARCWAEVRSATRASHAAERAPPSSSKPPPADMVEWAERLKAVEAACKQQAQASEEATHEAIRLTTEMQSRIASAHDTAASVAELSHIVNSSCATVEQVAREVAALRGTPMLADQGAPAANGRPRGGGADRGQVADVLTNLYGA